MNLNEELSSYIKAVQSVDKMIFLLKYKNIHHLNANAIKLCIECGDIVDEVSSNLI